MKRKIVIAAIQPNATACSSEREFYNIMRDYAHIAKQSGASVLVYPEGLSMWLSWCKESPRVRSLYWAEDRDVSILSQKSFLERFVDWFFGVVKLRGLGEWMSQAKHYRIMKRTFSLIAKEFGVVIVAGSLYTKQIDGLKNISMVFEKDGSLVGEAGKKYLVPIEESWGIKSDKSVDPILTSEANLGVCICYDLDFPDVVAELKQKGAEIICAPSGGWRPYPGYPFSIEKDMPQIKRAKEQNIAIVRPYQCGWMSPGMYFDGRTSIINKFGIIQETSTSTTQKEVVLAHLEIGYDDVV
jgi:predicted amidohydrolase